MSLHLHVSSSPVKRATMLDLSYMQAVPISIYIPKRYHLYVVGLGGNGSALARHIACLATTLQEQGNAVTLTFIDPDRV